MPLLQRNQLKNLTFQSVKQEYILAQACPSLNGIYIYSPFKRWMCNITNLIVFLLVKYIYLVDLNIQYILLTEFEGLG